ncbi:reverse transcriptase family protein [Frigoribacterium sp. VKM Ac-1396]|uniref:reverse transcriptase family protein n=1 Tax=Frigoribacterium sp. VKM Ac-1396 TaxID=2783821 RepID=UPI00351C56E5
MTGPSPASAALAREPDPGPDAVSVALADALLAAEWTVRGLTAAAGEAIDGPTRFWRPLARGLVRALPRAPHDDPRTLVALIARDPSFGDAVAEARVHGRPLRIVHHAPVTQEAHSADPRLLRLGTVADVARLLHLTVGELDWFADPGRWNRRVERGPLQHHRYEWRARPGRTPRLLEVPGFRLRDLQRIVLDEVLAAVPLHDAAHGFVPGRGAISGARRHVGREVVIALDLTSFFARVTAGQVFGALRREGLTDAVAHVLTGLCTNSVPPGVLSGMPAGGSPEQRSALRHALAVTHLAQGAPTSPALANVALRRLDSRLDGYARAAGATYTRYADDLAFSGDAALAGRADAFVRGVGRIVGAEGHELNPAKTRVRGAATRQVVTGIVVNQGTNTVRSEYDRLRAVLHNAARTGLEAQNWAGHPDFAAQLWGRIGWVEQLNPERGARLRAAFARVPR